MVNAKPRTAAKGRSRFGNKVEGGTTTPDPLKSEFCYNIPAIRGIQAGREYYTTMLRLSLLKKLFVFDEEDEVPPELRHQRRLNLTRANAIKKYIEDNPSSYILNSLTVMVDIEEMSFLPVDGQDYGTLQFSMDAKCLIIDGQHRNKGLCKLIEESPEMKDETISVVMYHFTTLERAQQGFSDLNGNAAKPTGSINILYDHRDPTATLTRKVLQSVEAFSKLTDRERNSLGKGSSKLFTLNGLEEANEVLLRGSDRSGEDATKLVIQYWSAVAENIKDWQDVLDKKTAASDVRQNYLHSHAIGLVALGFLGNELLKRSLWAKDLKILQKIDWSKNNPDWTDLVIFGGRINKSKGTAKAMADYILSKETPVLEKSIA